MNVASPFLARIFRALDRAEVEYCLLRGYEELVTPAVSQEVDLLLRPEHRRRFDDVVESHGFVSWPAWGYGPHRFYVAYDPEDDCWFKLDVVEQLRYGAPVRCLRLDLARDSLRRRRRRGPTWIPSPEDELVTLLLHCVLDKGRFRDAHQTRLEALWQEIRIEPEAQKRLFHVLASRLGRWGMLGVVQGFDLHDWDDLLRQRRRWTWRLFRRQPLRATWRHGTQMLLRRSRKLLFLVRRHGTSTVLLAPDGGGKSTLALALARDPWLQARVVYMGGNASARAFRLPAGTWIARRLRGSRQGRRRPLWRTLGALHRIAEDWFRHGIGRFHVMAGRFVVYDRFFYDTYLSPRSHTRRLRLRRWILQRTCPAPDLVLLLDAPGEVLHRRKGEHTPEALETQRRALLALGERLGHFLVVDTTSGPDAVRRRAIAHIWERYARRRGKRPGAAWLSAAPAGHVATPVAAGERERVIS